MKEVSLSKGYVAIVDDEDYELVSRFPWYASITKSNVYANRNANKAFPFSGMHRMVMNVTDPKTEVDHRNHIGLDNRRENLRKSLRKQNSYNLGPRKGREIKGVSWHVTRNKWRAYITPDGKQIHLGLFSTKEEAAQAYDEAARKYFGEFAYLNGDLKEVEQ